MKKLIAVLILTCLTTPSFAEQKIRLSSSTSVEEINARNPNRFSHIEYTEPHKKKAKKHKSQQSNDKKFNKQALNNKLNKTFGKDNADAMRKQWSNLNN